jgi:hypothetical protein
MSTTAARMGRDPKEVGGWWSSGAIKGQRMSQDGAVALVAVSKAHDHGLDRIVLSGVGESFLLD